MDFDNVKNDDKTLKFLTVISNVHLSIQVVVIPYQT